MPSPHETPIDIAKLLRASARYLSLCLPIRPFSFPLLLAAIPTASPLRFQQLFFSPAWVLCSPGPLRAVPKPTLAQLNLHNTRARRNPSGFLQVAVSKARKPPCSCAQLAHSRFRYSAKTNRDFAATVLAASSEIRPLIFRFQTTEW